MSFLFWFKLIVLKNVPVRALILVLVSVPVPPHDDVTSHAPQPLFQPDIVSFVFLRFLLFLLECLPPHRVSRQETVASSASHRGGHVWCAPGTPDSSQTFAARHTYVLFRFSGAGSLVL